MAQYFVTGGTSGIGRACVLELLRQGSTVVAIGRTRPHADELLSLAPEHDKNRLTVLVGDLTDATVAADFASTNPMEPVAGLVNAAGVVSAGGIEVESLDGWHRTLSGNIDTAFIMTQALLPRLIANGSGSIVNVSSSCSRRLCESVAYSVSKAALDMFTLHLARDLAHHAIRVNSVNPGVVRTNLHLTAGILDQQGYEKWITDVAALHPLGIVPVESVRSAILFLLGPESAWTTGATLYIDGGRSLI